MVFHLLWFSLISSIILSRRIWSIAWVKSDIIALEAIVIPADLNGAGFDATLNDGLRDAVRSAIGQVAQGEIKTLHKIHLRDLKR